MNQKEVINFMQTYQRITQQMFKDTSKYASIIMSLNKNHQIQKIKYN
jgi:D-glycerate 3-kinase